MRPTPMWLLAVSSIAFAQQEVTFPAAKAARAQFDGEVEAILRMPQSLAGKVPAIVFIHTAGGFLEDRSVYDFYAQPLRDAGVATLYVSLFRSATDKFPSYFVPHAFGALNYLASHPQIDQERIGIMGISLGGILSLYAASASLTSEFASPGRRFAAHVAIYPVCWIHETVARGNEQSRKALGEPYKQLTGAPIHILAGERDELEEPDSCQKFLNVLSLDARSSIGLTVYPGATHAWDKGKSFRYFDRGCRTDPPGRGCYVTVEFNPEVTAKGRQFATDFFLKHLKK